jgi:hypothetical protein
VCDETSEQRGPQLGTLERCSTGLSGVHRTICNGQIQRSTATELKGRLTWPGHRACSVCTEMSGAPDDRSSSFSVQRL